MKFEKFIEKGNLTNEYNDFVKACPEAEALMPETVGLGTIGFKDVVIVSRTRRTAEIIGACSAVVATGIIVGCAVHAHDKKKYGER